MKQRTIYLYALTAILLWSTAGTAFKLALKGLDFVQLLFIASTTAWMILLAIVLLRRQFSKLVETPLKNLPKSMIGGFLNPFLYYLILLKAYTLLPAQIAQPLNYTWPVMLVLLSAIFLKKGLIWKDLIAILISFSGVIVISAQGQNLFNTRIHEPVGVLLAVGSSIIWAWFWIHNIKDARSEIIKLTLNFFFGSLFTGVYLLVTHHTFPTWSVSVVPALYVGLTEMAVAFVCWLIALENSDSHARISNLVFISPFLALIFIHLILQENIYFTTPVGLVLIIAGILFQQIQRRQPSTHVGIKNHPGN